MKYTFLKLFFICVIGLLAPTAFAQYTTYSTCSYELSNDGTTLTTKETVTGETAITTMHFGSITNGGLPGLPNEIIYNDGTKTKSEYNVTAGQSTITVKSGKFTGDNLETGGQTITQLNAQGYVTETESSKVVGSVSLLVAKNIYGAFTSYGAPLQCTNAFTGLVSQWTYDGARSRLSSYTSALGVVSNYSDYDVLSRPAESNWNGIENEHQYNPGGQFGGMTKSTHEDYESMGMSITDAVGRPQSSISMLNGFSNTAVYTHTQTHSSCSTLSSLTSATHNCTVRESDGGYDMSNGNTTRFGGSVDGQLKVNADSLFEQRTEVAEYASQFQVTCTDAWGRTTVIKQPSSDSSKPEDTTMIQYSDVNNTFQRVISEDAAGRTSIVESDPYASAPYSRQGIDMNGDGMLSAVDRYTETKTTTTASSIDTIVSLNEDQGLREIYRTSYNPSSLTSTTSINEGEMVVTRVVNYVGKTITTSSTKGWVSTNTFNDLGLTTDSDLTGVGIPNSTVNSVFRKDGSLKSIDSNDGGLEGKVEYDPNGIYTSIVDPLKGEIFGEQSYNNGMQRTVVDGRSAESSLDGTQSDFQSQHEFDQSRSLETAGSMLKETINPAAGAETVREINAAGVKEKHDYIEGADPVNEWMAGGLMEKYINGRGDSTLFEYSDDGAKDLLKREYQRVDGGSDALVLGQTTATPTESFAYDAAGRIAQVDDASGRRMYAYSIGRVTTIDYENDIGGLLDGYSKECVYDNDGRKVRTDLSLNGDIIHSYTTNYNQRSNQVTGYTADDFEAVYQRHNNTLQITGVTRGSVVQNWVRNDKGVIIEANSNTPNAQSFEYENFDSQIRRLTNKTYNGTWAYTYDDNGQLERAVHPSLGVFNYDPDGIGRRSNDGKNALNQQTQVDNTPRLIYFQADPEAKVEFNGVELDDFNGSYAIGLPFSAYPSGEFYHWKITATLEGEGEPGAGPDAVAESKGYVRIPPAEQDFSYGDDGNRQGEGNWEYFWDQKNQLTHARTVDRFLPASAIGYEIEFKYDSDNRRIGKTVQKYEHGVATSKTDIIFVWDGWDLLYEKHTDEQGTTILERRYVWGNDIAEGALGGAGGLFLIRETTQREKTQEEIAQEVADGTPLEDVNPITDQVIDLYPLYDGSGHVVGLVDEQNTLLATYTYGPFGELLRMTGSHAESNPWRYATKYCDTETNLHYFGFRYYDAACGQWLSREPLGEDESINLYAYCHNDPINKVDYLGLWETDATLNEFAEDYGDEEEMMKALTSVLFAGYKLKQGTHLWQDDWEVDHKKKFIYISDDSMGFTKSDSNAASQLYQALSDDPGFYKAFNLSETWGGLFGRVGEGGLKVVGAGFTYVGSTALALAPEPTMLTKAGAAGGYVYGTNLLVDGGTQIFRREGGIDVLGNAAGAYGQWIAGDKGEKAARFWMGISQFSGTLGASLGTSKAGSVTFSQIKNVEYSKVIRELLTSKKLSIPNSLSGHKVNQGFSGVYDEVSEGVFFQPSTYDKLKPGWVSAKQGHIDVLVNSGFEDIEKVRGFAMILQKDGSLLLKWKSGLNKTAQNPSRLLPEAERAKIIEVIKKATGRKVKNL